MPRFEHPNFSFDYPRDWEDRSIVAVAAPAAPNQPTATNVVFTRDRCGDNEDVKGYADRQLAEIAKRLDAFQLIEQKEMQIDNAPAVDIRFAWRGSSGPLVQRLTIVATGERQVLNITCTTSKKDASRCGPIFDRILASLELGLS